MIYLNSGGKKSVIYKKMYKNPYIEELRYLKLIIEALGIKYYVIFI